MPELPEVECLKRSLEPHLLGRAVLGVRLRRRDICNSWGLGKRGQMVRTPFQVSALLADDSIVRLERHGKQLALTGSSGRVVCIHLGMTGQVLIRPKGQPFPYGDHVHAFWSLDARAGTASQWMVFRDPRRFGRIVALPSEAALRDHHWRLLGPDALTVTADHLARTLADSTRAVKAALLDQRVLAGVGNIYADEALFNSGIAPRARCSRLQRAHWDRLAVGIRTVLTQAIERGGSTLRDYRNADGDRGQAQDTHNVYGRAGLPCLVCGHNLASATVGQRTTVWCPRCQRSP